MRVHWAKLIVPRVEENNIANHCAYDVESLEHLVKCNSQVREIAFKLPYKISVYDGTLKHMPQLEALTILYGKKTEQNVIQSHTANTRKIYQKYHSFARKTIRSIEINRNFGELSYLDSYAGITVRNNLRYFSCIIVIVFELKYMEIKN